MHQFKAPAIPGTFETDVAKNRAAVKYLFDQGKLAVVRSATKKPKATSTNKAAAAKDKKPENFPDTWKNFKAALSAAQHGKCGFCEGRAIGQGFGEVEHFAPKGEIQALGDDEKTWGVELPHLSNVKGRTTTPVSATGYWWLAYKWDNYLLACSICNGQWKRSIFPIKERRAAPPALGDQETHYLLNPFHGADPKDHLEFGPLGEVKAKTTPAGISTYGWETIRTLGLDRPSLREQRRPVASKIHKKIDGLANATVARRLELLEDIHLDGTDDQVFCGMVRAIFEQRTGITWAQLETELTGP